MNLLKAISKLWSISENTFLPIYLKWQLPRACKYILTLAVLRYLWKQIPQSFSATYLNILSVFIQFLVSGSRNHTSPVSSSFLILHLWGKQPLSQGKAPLYTLPLPSPILRLLSFDQNVLCCESRVIGSSITVSFRQIPVSCLWPGGQWRSLHHQGFDICVVSPLTLVNQGNLCL